MDVVVNKRTLNVIWTDPEDKKYTYNGNPIYPSYKIEDKNDETKTGYISDDDSQRYTTAVKVTSSKLPVDAGRYTATVEFNYKERLSENYVLSVTPKDYVIDKATLNEVEPVEVHVTYGTDMSGIRTAVNGKINETYGAKYVLTSSFNINDANGRKLPDDAVPDVSKDPYSSDITYTLNSDVNPDTNHEGKFTAKVYVDPAETSVSVIGKNC